MLDLELPPAHEPVGSYVMAVRTGDLGFAVEIEAVVEARR